MVDAQSRSGHSQGQRKKLSLSFFEIYTPTVFVIIFLYFSVPITSPTDDCNEHRLKRVNYYSR